MENLTELLHRHDVDRRPWFRRWSILGSIGLHVGLAAAFIIAPTLLASKAPPPEFVSIQIVPSAALGQIAPPPEPRVETPPAETRPAEKAPPKAKPEPPREKPVAVSKTRSSKTREAEERDRPQAEAPAPLPTTPAQPTPRQGSPRGSSMATGAAPEITGFDDPDFTYGYYADLMLSRIRAQWERPPLGGDIEMVVHFTIGRGGEVKEVKILRSSGYNSFDRAGLLAVQRATMPPLPKSYRGGSLGVRLIIR